MVSRLIAAEEKQRRSAGNHDAAQMIVSSERTKAALALVARAIVGVSEPDSTEAPMMTESPKIASRCDEVKQKFERISSRAARSEVVSSGKMRKLTVCVDSYKDGSVGAREGRVRRSEVCPDVNSCRP